MGESVGKNPFVFNVKNEKGLIIFTGTIKQIAANFNASDGNIYKCYYEGKRYMDQYSIIPVDCDRDTTISQAKIQEHLWTDKGARNYEYKKGYPNRYKDAACRRFTPL